MKPSYLEDSHPVLADATSPPISARRRSLRHASPSVWQAEPIAGFRVLSRCATAGIIVDMCWRRPPLDEVAAKAVLAKDGIEVVWLVLGESCRLNC
jgi:hypothetical protein